MILTDDGCTAEGVGRRCCGYVVYGLCGIRRATVRGEARMEEAEDGSKIGSLFPIVEVVLVSIW